MQIFSHIFLLILALMSPFAYAGEEGGAPAVTSNNLIEDYKKAYESCTREASKTADKKDDYEASYSSYFKECIEARGFQVKDDAVLHDFDTSHLEGPAIGLKPAKKPEKKKAPEGETGEKGEKDEKSVSKEGSSEPKATEKKEEAKDKPSEKEATEEKKP